MDMPKTAAALGIFDGVHLGHREVLRTAAGQKENGLMPCAFTFPPESTAFKGAGGYIYSSAEKEHILREHCGMERILSPEFSTVCGMEGEEFARDILAGELNATFVCCGMDFRFGRGAACGAEELRTFGRRYGFRVQTVEDVCLDGARVSSTEIRHLLLSGDVERADALLGAPYMIRRTVRHGAQIGRTIGFPTINQVFEQGQLVPAFGVYASVTRTGGREYRSMTNIGVKPTVDYGGAPLAETYIHGFSGDLYGSAPEVRLLRFIRPERRFSSTEELRKQIASDIEAAVKMP
ncbi:MAG: riboflavin biosynthesis protein RibF [Ruminococcus sp.]|nr:riboflavin biosynthesis protein RibF [Ruminococcus sp.]